MTSVKRACWRSLPIAATVLHPGAPGTRRRLSVALAEGAEALELLGQVQVKRAAGNDGVDSLDRDQVLGAGDGARVRGQGAAEGIDLAGFDVEPGSAVAAEAGQVLRQAARPACRS